jgi:glycosyltransferase involved in cell wall biosynthesis
MHAFCPRWLPVHVAIVIPAFNVADLLADAILSVLDQTHTDWSLVIVDDGSTDATAAVAAQFKDARVRLIRKPHAGVSAARNAGISALRNQPPEGSQVGDRSQLRSGAEREMSEPLGAARAAVTGAILFLDGDDWLAPDALVRLAECLEDEPGAVAAVGRYARADPSAVHLSRRPPQGRLLERLLTRNLFANGGHLLIRREAIEAAGDFRTDLHYGEDWEYWTRLAAQGVFASVPSCLPLLFVRERLGGAYLSRATDPEAYRPALNAIYHNPDLALHLGPARLAALSRRAEAEMAWTVGRELVRRGRQRDGLRWLGRSIRAFPSPKRMALVGLSWLRVGPFRPYRTATEQRFFWYRQCD